MKSRLITILVLLMIALTIATVVASFSAIDKVKHITLPKPLAPTADSLSAVLITVAATNSEGSPKMLERPLFWQERRPYVATVKKVDGKKPIAAVEEDDPFEKVQLIGVYSGGAIFNIEGKKQRLYIGDEVAQWTLELMNADSVIFVQGTENRLLQLEHAIVNAPRSKPTKPNTIVTKAGEQATPPQDKEQVVSPRRNGAEQALQPITPEQAEALLAKELDKGLLPILNP